MREKFALLLICIFEFSDGFALSGFRFNVKSQLTGKLRQRRK